MYNAESDWVVSHVESESEIVLYRKKLAATTRTRRSSGVHVIFLKFECSPQPGEREFYSAEDFDTFEHIEEYLAGLERRTGAELVAVVSTWQQRDFVFYSDRPSPLLAAAELLQQAYPEFTIESECNPDQGWQAYCDMPPSDHAPAWRFSQN